MLKSLFTQWQSYQAKVVPKGAPLVQREECRRAFYAGAAAMFGLALEATVPQDEDECEANLARLHAELEAFPDDMRNVMEICDPRVHPSLVPEGSRAVVIAEHQQEFRDLPSIRTPCGQVITRWTMSDEERAAILRGEDIYVTLLSHGAIRSS